MRILTVTIRADDYTGGHAQALRAAIYAYRAHAEGNADDPGRWQATKLWMVIDGERVRWWSDPYNREIDGIAKQVARERVCDEWVLEHPPEQQRNPDSAKRC